ncbi:MAG: alpha-amlyase [Bacteroidetes bacterium HGW-Bacteroidetes-11]|jgi:glycosidase|nr:MAG: alpha-amlyase [Bacteroidetes bacterium HGW-Bacteroidetes-11]
MKITAPMNNPLKSLLIFGLIAILYFPATGQKQSAKAENITFRVEPPSWWAGMKHAELQLLVYGKDISLTEVVFDYPGVTLAKKHLVENPNYLFLDLLLAKDVKPGSFDIRFMRGKKALFTYKYVLNEREPGSAERIGFGPSDVVYLLMPDRFANGDPSNDNMPGMLEPANRSNPSGRHGGDIAGIRNNLDYIKDLGMTAIWINPVLENNNPAYSYHGYAITDFYKVDPRFGTNTDYVALVKEANSKGLKVIKDMIFNHCGINHWFINDLPMSNWVHQFPEFTRSNFRAEALTDPYATEYDLNKLLQGWFDTNMPDFDQRNPFVTEYLIQNSIWWIELAGLDGIRLDTQPYPYKEMIAAWGKRVFEEYPNFNIVGEAWLNREGMNAYYQKDAIVGDGYNSYLPSITDFSMYGATSRAFTEADGWSEGMARLYYVLAQDFLWADPTQNLIFLDNHDLNRYFNSVGSDMNAMKMALTFLLTTRGIPQIYYGTELLMDGAENQGHGNIRKDFPGGWPGDTTNAFTREGRTAAQNEIFSYMQRLLQFRKNSLPIAQGNLRHFIPADGVYVYFRNSGDETVMVVLNNSHAPKKLDMARYAEMLKGYTSATDVISLQKLRLESGIECQARSAMVLELSR